ncbi:CRISPR-associated protein Csx3 [Candidatus Magnetominusculus xianensis]|uniref:CRISPR-associated protein Csx3 n=1 Tax=Candidatus Magnetominusculus xianensis TaxID=1748249 RepID=A0ABR5SKU7_9BACT|nr:CRISPR-associated protein Csx3 [Candidatus Magnetominusculus xianensis]KWT94949.1 CRISPR-associated protein Csx3 [Candidatus Magnetominusculus xianensis]MBF0405195.1 hypothetical protein [Nitrospirota bacterium]
MAETVIIDIESLYASADTAKLSNIEDYIRQIIGIAGNGNDVVLTGAGPVWLYLKAAHALHGKARKLIYSSPVTGNVLIFDHSPD